MKKNNVLYVIFSGLLAIGFNMTAQQIINSFEVQHLNNSIEDTKQIDDARDFVTDMKKNIWDRSIGLAQNVCCGNRKTTIAFVCVSKKTGKVCGFAKFFIRYTAYQLLIGKCYLENCSFIVDATHSKSDQKEIIKTMLKSAESCAKGRSAKKIVFEVDKQNTELAKSLISLGFRQRLLAVFKVKGRYDILEKKI